MLYLPASYTVLDCLRGLSAHSTPGVLSGVVDTSLFCSCAGSVLELPWLVPLVLSFRPSFSSHGLDCSVSATTSICRWYMPCRGLSFHDGSFSPSLGFSCLRYSLRSSSLGCSTLELVTAEQQCEQSIFLVDTTLDANLCSWLEIGLQGYLSQSFSVLVEGS